MSDNPFILDRQPSEQETHDIAELCEHFSEMGCDIERLCPPSRERSLALTNLEQSAMWATKAIALGIRKEGN